MDSGQRRRSTASATRLGLLIAAISTAAIFLAHELIGGRSEAVAAVAESVPGAAPRTALEGRSAAPRAAAQPAGDPQPADRQLEARLREKIGTALAEAGRRSRGKVTARNTTISVQVFDGRRDRTIVSIDADRSLRPASNTKLLTSAAALVQLGADWHFTTRFESAAPLQDGRLRGDLVARAGADPLYDPEGGGRVDPLLAPVVQELRALGIDGIDGDLVLDEGSYASPGPGPGWPPESQHWQEHCALSGGFTANAGCLTAVVRPGTVGGPAWSRVHPLANGLDRLGTVKTVKARARLNIAVGATSAGATLRGEIPADVAHWEDRFAHPDPVAMFGSVLHAALADGGISLAGSVVRRRDAPPARTLAVLRTPLVDVLGPINTHSNNSVADQLFLALGAAIGGEGSRDGGARAVELALEQLGVSREGFVQVDGSGLSRDNRVTARQLVSLLGAVAKLEEGTVEVFFDSLPVAGRTGSLENRMKNTPAAGRVRAKTGWIEGTSALSGYVMTTAGQRVCFSILVDYPRVSGLNTYCWKPMQDAICNELVNWHD